VTGFPLDTSFRPSRWLRGPHFQTILSTLPPRRSRVERRAIPVRAASEELLLDCGDGVVLQAFHSSPAKRGREPGKRLAVLLHGWEGSADSTYVLSASQTLFDLGFEVVRLNLRDHGATHHLNRDLFHSCRLPEVLSVNCQKTEALASPSRPAGHDALLPVDQVRHGYPRSFCRAVSLNQILTRDGSHSC